MSARVRMLVGLAALALLEGCAAKQLKFVITAPPGTNQDRSMYMLVRQVDPKKFPNEAYSEVVPLIDATDPTILDRHVIYPGSIQRFEVAQPKDGPVAVYFFFTAPDGEWHRIVKPTSGDTVAIELAGNRMAPETRPAEQRGGAGEDGAKPPDAKPPEAPKLEAPKLPEMPKLPGA